ncbi:T9SS type A sorting domain-containing protein [Brumimicrobium glaciale]|uniref:T9SS type A sorting domain-containing protein n=1 Tax=Brumimicrobium glaciale TaxID=200475 RepID=A0A4Q4KRY4_9FLAO|nr:GEVED domain-containing protein [Brumimicrobium glaciale]RYM35775.1 T9SS type A sorting domain-containing protein [Brumimicrobium glaciale]
MKTFLLKGMLFIAAFAFGSNLNAQSYCAYTTTNTGNYITSFSTTGGFPDIVNNNTGQGPNGYSDYTTMIVGGYETQQITFTITATGGTYGYSVFIDWDNDFAFSAAEKVYGTSSYSPTPNTASFIVPTGQSLGNYRMRVIADWLNGAPGPCTGSYAEAEDYTFQVITPPTCLPAQNLNVSGVTATTLNFGWTEINTATEWQVEYGPIGFVQGSAAGNLQSNVVANPYTATIVQGNEYDFYVRSVCSIGDTSVWAGPYEFKYCEVSAQNTFYYTSAITSTNALVNVNYSAAGIPPGSYANETAQTFESFESQSFNVNTTYSSASNYTNVWVDWNRDMVFDASELMAGSGSAIASQSLSIVVPAATPQGDYRMRVRSDYGNTSNPSACGSAAYGSTVDFNLTIVAPPSCLPVNNIIVNNVSETTVALGWTSSGTATTWNIEYGPAGFAPGTGFPLTATTNPFTITNLTGNTNYDFYIQADCGGGDLSYWSSVFGPVVTDCGPYLANGLCEGFDINLSSTIGCWRVRDENNDGDAWGMSTSIPNTGAYSAVFYSDLNAGNNDDYLISPQLVMTGIEAMKFSFRVQSANEPNDFQVLLSTTGTNVADFTDTIMDLAEYANIVYQDTVIDLTSYTGPVYIAFHIPPGGVDGWNLFIDDVCFGECIPTPGQDGSVDVCVLENSVDLSDNIVSHNNSYGRWEFPANQALIVDDTMFNVGMMAEGSHEVMYIVEGLCQEDTTIATINVYKASSAGIDGVMEVCKNTPSNLFSALSGNIDFGGTWYDPANVALPNSQPNAPSIPGMYQYTYITNNGHCPGDTSIVTITVDGGCDNLSLGNDILTDVSVYPNPATSILTIVNPSNATSLKVEMLDMNGRIVLVENKALNNASEATLTIDYLEKGIYTLRVFNTEGQKTFKVVKQ